MTTAKKTEKVNECKYNLIDFQKTFSEFSLTENPFSGKIYLYTIHPWVLVLHVGHGLLQLGVGEVLRHEVGLEAEVTLLRPLVGTVGGQLEVHLLGSCSVVS